MENNTTYTKNSAKSFDDTIASLEKNIVDNMFRVLYTHNVTATLAEKEFEINPLKIVEVCNAGFAFNALRIDPSVALFMPCKYIVAENDGVVSVTLFLPSVISRFLQNDKLQEFAQDVEGKLKHILDISVIE